MHSWRVLILPFCEGSAIYRRYNFNEPWDGPNNRKLHSLTVSPYHCPSANTPATDTSYVALVGPGTVWLGQSPTTMAMVKDDPSSTIMLVEVANSGIHWMEPRDLPLSAANAGVNAKNAVGISSHHGKRANVLMRDVTTASPDSQTPAEVLNALLTIAGGEPLVEDISGNWTLKPPAAAPKRR